MIRGGGSRYGNFRGRMMDCLTEMKLTVSLESGKTGANAVFVILFCHFAFGFAISECAVFCGTTTRKKTLRFRPAKHSPGGVTHRVLCRTLLICRPLCHLVPTDTLGRAL